ncbi:MAG: hypothetical protein L0Z48_04675 [candidate division Zixibacteria bacterium]|nr:hypothetical protein [candidate division Zixibacteria bacterium]MCI0595820.1 hypothetical protein [candidate division Zixibacteria bacterium]
MRRARNLDRGIEKLPDDAVSKFFQHRSELILLGSFLLALILSLAAWWVFS